MKNVCILGSTGSIGQLTLEVIDSLGNRFYPYALSCYKNIALLKQQVNKYKPKYICITDKEASEKFTPPKGAILLTGIDGLKALATHPKVDILLNAIVGSIGIHPTLEAIRAKKRIAMANKETLVAYGEIVMKEIDKNKTILLPVDSEHSAIYQCLNSRQSKIKRIILTASGGPFLHKEITPEITSKEALKHPTWKMGAKITIDSATLMNKGLEMIEASILFNVPPENIEVVIHPQSIIHSAVEFIDGSIIAQLSSSDMRLPIQYALTYPERLPSLVKSLKFDELQRLEFFKPDFNKFPCLKLAYKSAYEGGTMPCVLNSANEIAVNSFLRKEIKFSDIPVIIEQVMNTHHTIKSPSRLGSARQAISDIESADNWARKEALTWICEKYTNPKINSEVV
ncbi:1-deoxy-D-xylulose-5-phosphate reductoisomerase [candidate division WOR-3 bacterium]|nr:1-deoxy-D-xylulose-5-phosphate reductoisomerase [candidate division WOR-3 bacterium]